LSYVGREV